jgi:DNA-binding NarL/FixJ family response regulator
MTKKSRIVLADDHPIVLGGLRNLIQAEPDLELVGEASSGLAALKVIRQENPDVAVIDISMPELNGIAVSRRLAEEMPAVKVLILTLHEDRAYLQQALEVGVRGYVLKRSAAENFIQAVRSVIVGGLYVDSAIANLVFDAKSQRPQWKASYGDDLPLTERETEVLKLVALGFTGKEIARKLNIGIKSIETYRVRGSEKLGLRTRAELVRYASAQGWLVDV